MSSGSSSTPPAPNRAVFLSYASEDADAARRICEALRAAGVEVWFDQSELRGGDAWDQKIRKQIKECTLFVPIISANTQARTEGYFRLEWRLADQRTHLMAKGRPFLLPVVIDDTRDSEAHVPDSFVDVQWTRLPRGEAPSAFCSRVGTLLDGGTGGLSEPGNHRRDARLTQAAPAPRWPWPRIAIAAIISVIAGLAIWRPWPGARDPGLVSGGAPRNAVAKPDNGSEVAQLPATAPLARARAILAQADVFRAELDTAVGLADGAIKADGANAEAFAVRALVDWRYAVENLDHSPARLDAMRQHARQAMSLDPTSSAAVLAQAQAMVLLNDTPTTREAAVKMLEPLARGPDVDVQMLLALGWLERASREKALAFFDRAARMPGAAGQAHFGRAMLFWREREYRAASESIDQALAVERATKFLFWKSYLQLVWEGDAAAADRTGRELPPQLLAEDSVVSHRYSTQLFLRDYDGALATLRAFPRDFIGSGDGSGTTGYFKGYVLARAGKTAAAEIEWRAALDVVERRLKVAPNERALLVHKAFLLASLGDKPAAEKLWRATRELFDGSTASWGEHHIRLLLLSDDEALDYLASEIERPDPPPSVLAGTLRLDPYLDHLRRHPRFAALLARAEADPRLSPRATKSSPKPTTKSVAVLAFDNLSDDQANEYFSDGISEELINLLGRVPGLTVKGRTSAFYFKGKRASSAEIAEQLGVAYLVRGGVRKFGNKVQITAQLTRAASDELVWSSEPLTREVENVLVVQEEIAGLIAASLQLKLAASGRATKAVHPEAHRLLLEGRYFWNQRSEQSLVQAETAFRQALALAPEFAEAYAGIADVYQVRLTNWMNAGEEKKAREDIQKARQAARRAIEIDPTLAEPYATLGYATFNDGSLQEAAALLQRSLVLNPNLAVARRYYVPVLSAQGRIDLAIEEARRAVEIDPLSMMNCTVQARTLGHAQRYVEAEAATARALRLQTDEGPWPRWPRLVSLWSLGRRAEAIEEARVILRSVPHTDVRGAGDAEALWVLRMAGLPEEVDLHLKNLEARLAPDSYLRGFSLMAAGRTNEAWTYLQRMPRGNTLNFPLYSVIFDAVREKPRFMQLIESLGCSEEYKLARTTLARMKAEQPTRKQ